MPPRAEARSAAPVGAGKSHAMSQEKRFGKRVAMPSTVQIIRELKILMRHDAEQAGTAEHGAPASAPAPSPLPLGTDEPAPAI